VVEVSAVCWHDGDKNTQGEGWPPWYRRSVGRMSPHLAAFKLTRKSLMATRAGCKENLERPDERLIRINLPVGCL